MRRRRAVALFTAAVLTVTAVIAISAVPVNAANTKTEIPNKVIVYYNDYSGEKPTVKNAEWKKDGSYRFKYSKKGFITYDSGCSIKWTVKNNKAAKAVAGSKSIQAISTSTYNKGKLKKVLYKLYDENGKLDEKGSEQYSYKKDWISNISGSIYGKKYKISYTYKFYSNGLPKTVVEKYADPDLSLKTTYSFNKKGLLTKEKSEYLNNTFKYKYDDKGRVIEKITYDDGTPWYRTVYKYDGKTARDKKTYMAVINYPDFHNPVRDVKPDTNPAVLVGGAD